MNPAFFDTVFHGPAPEGGWPEVFVVVTACNPRDEATDEESNLAANVKLAEVLRREGRRFGPMTGASPDGAHREPGFWADAGLRLGLALGKRFGQVAVFLVENGVVSVVPCDNPAGARHVASWAERWTG